MLESERATGDPLAALAGSPGQLWEQTLDPVGVESRCLALEARPLALDGRSKR
jgi:hypothetical protein